MRLKFYGYKKCGTCRKAEKWLNEHDIPYDYIPVVDDPPSRDEIFEMYKKSGLPIRKWFNTSGKKYRELGLKDKVKHGDEEALLSLLASDGMLLKRPIVTDGEQVTVGFNEDTFRNTWSA
ncbi:MAG TPA: arsenate reductase family protein [Bacillales bacterium]|nr:arsenate reductase family protein [Bacillales bacterium]